MFWTFTLTYIAICSTLLELYAFICVETVIEKAISKARRTGKRLVVVCQAADAVVRPSMLDLELLDYIAPGDIPQPDAIVLDLFTMTKAGNASILEVVPPQNLFCAAKPWYCFSAYIGTKYIALCYPPYEPYIWVVPNPLTELKRYIPCTSTPQ